MDIKNLITGILIISTKYILKFIKMSHHFQNQKQRIVAPFKVKSNKKYIFLDNIF